MAEVSDFADLLQRVRAGDQDAATQLIRQYEQDLRVAIHVRLTDPVMRRLVDSSDVFQSVMFNFYLRVASGQYDLETPSDLFKVLKVMIKNKIIDLHHKYKTDKRNQDRNVEEDVAELEIAAPQTSPSSVIANRELLQEAHRRLTDEERQLAEHRAAGASWEQIAQLMGGEPNTRRMQLKRALDRVLKELNLDV